MGLAQIKREAAITGEAASINRRACRRAGKGSAGRRHLARNCQIVAGPAHPAVAKVHSDRQFAFYFGDFLADSGVCDFVDLELRRELAGAGCGAAGNGTSVDQRRLRRHV